MPLAFNPANSLSDRKMTIAGFQSPGIVRFTNVSQPRDLEEKVVKGVSGSTIKFQGARSCHFSIFYDLYDFGEDWGDWGELKPELDKLPKGDVDKAVAVQHPYLQDAGITAIVIEDIIAPIETHESGLWTVEIKCYSYMPPKVAKTKIVGAAAAGAKKAATSPEQAAADAQAAEVANALDEARATIAKQQAARMGQDALDQGGNQ